MSLSEPYQQYKFTQVQTASPERLVVMLYDGALANAEQGIKALEVKDWEKANHLIGKAQEMVVELMAALNLDTGEIARNLYKIYEYVRGRLVEANVRKEPAPLREVITLLGELKEAWAEISRRRSRVYQQG